jgi:hypothetical protein
MLKDETEIHEIKKKSREKKKASPHKFSKPGLIFQKTLTGLKV